MKKLLITGSNGFVGSYFINKYQDKYKIKTFSFLKDDINNLDCSDIDVVFHLSALVHQMGGASCEEYEKVNVTQTLQLAKKAKESGVKQFVFMSTVKVYGEETDSVYTEKSTCSPEDEYGKSKVLEFFLNMFVRYVYRHSSNFAISTKGFENKIIPYLNYTKEIFYAPNWADYLNKDLEKFSFGDGNKTHFTFAGNIGTVQNLDNVIDAFGKLDNEFLIKAQLNIIGDGSYLEKLKTKVENNKYKNIVFWGRKPREEIYKYLEASSFLIVSLVNKEIFSLTVPAKTQTYIATAKPIVAIINGEAANIIKENELGLVCSPDNIEEIKSTFIDAIQSSEERRKMYIKNSELLTNTIFNKETIIDNLLALLKRG